MMPSDGLSSSVSEFIQEPNPNPNPTSNPSAKRKRNLPGTPDPDAEVIALSPNSLMATNRFMCEICNKGFQRDQNLQLHRRGHNLPWKLKQRTNKEVKKKVYLCPEKSCVHNDPSRALGDLTGIKKHYSRKHGEKKWKCEKCSKKYAVQSDWKAHNKICGTREYKCDCGTLFCRKDSFITHRAFCDALAGESSRFTSSPVPPSTLNLKNQILNDGSLINTLQFAGNPQFPAMFRPDLGNNSDNMWSEIIQSPDTTTNMYGLVSSSAKSVLKEEELNDNGNLTNSMYYNETSKSHMSATALLQKAATIGSTRSNSPGLGFGLINSNNNNNNNNNINTSFFGSFDQSRRNEVANFGELLDPNSQMMMMTSNSSKNQLQGNMTRDFLGVGGNNYINNINENNNIREFLQQEIIAAKFGAIAADSGSIEIRQYNSSNSTSAGGGV